MLQNFGTFKLRFSFFVAILTHASQKSAWTVTSDDASFWRHLFNGQIDSMLDQKPFMHNSGDYVIYEWVQIDMSDAHLVVEIVALNVRQERKNNQLARNLIANVGNEPRTGKGTAKFTANPVCDTLTAWSEHARIFRCEEPLEGRYVLIQMGGSNPITSNLEFEEVDVVILEEKAQGDSQHDGVHTIFPLCVIFDHVPMIKYAIMIIIFKKVFMHTKQEQAQAEN